MSKKINLFMIKDEVVEDAINAFGNALKYICEIGNRKKDEYNLPYAFWYYEGYLGHYYKLIDSNLFAERSARFTPREFYKALTTTDFICEDDLLIEFLFAIQTYLFKKENIEYEVWALPFYFDDSYENYKRKGYSTNTYKEYVKNYLISELGYSKKELHDMIVTGGAL